MTAERLAQDLDPSSMADTRYYQPPVLPVQHAVARQRRGAGGATDDNSSLKTFSHPVALVAQLFQKRLAAVYYIAE